MTLQAFKTQVFRASFLIRKAPGWANPGQKPGQQQSGRGAGTRKIMGKMAGKAGL